MTSTNDGKDVKSNQISGQKAKTYYIELYKTIESRLSTASELDARTGHLCEAWRRVHCLCLHSASPTHPHLINWVQRHTAQTLLQSEWQKNADNQKALQDAIDFFIGECQKDLPTRVSPPWETQLLQRAQWFKKVIPDPWGNSVLKALLGLPDPSLASSTGEGPTDQEILEWLKEERGVFFVTRLRQLGTSNCTELTKVALKLASAVMDRVRACMATMSDAGEKVKDHRDKEGTSKSPTFMEILTKEAGFTVDILELITDIEFVLLHKEQSKCIDLAKQTSLSIGYQLVERLINRLELSPHEKRLWKNSKKVATLIAQVMVARCMVVPVCANTARSTLYGCSRSLVKLIPEERLPATMAALAAPAATSRHLHLLAHAVHAECKNERKPFVCELYIRAITTGMNELERLKLNKEKESEARAAEQTLSSWFTQLGSLLGESARLAYECALTAFSVHPSRAMYERICAAPTLQPHPGQTLHKDLQEPTAETNKEFGSWATDSRSQTNFVKTSETLNLKKIQQHSNVLSTAVLNEGETLGLSPELCQDLIVLLSGPRVKTLSWDMDKEILIENCRSYMERTHGGTKALTTELKYLNLNPDSFNHLPEEEDEDEGDIYYGIEKGYEHLVELQDPEEIWEDAFSDIERTESCYSTDDEILVPVLKRKKKTRRLSATTDEGERDPLSIAPKPRSRSEEGNKDRSENHSKDKSKDIKKKERHKKDKSASRGKKKDKHEKEPKPLIESDPLMLETEPPQPKPKKERKKREKKEKKEKKQPKEKKIPKKKTPVSSALSRLIGKKVIRVNAQCTQQKICGTIRDTDYNNQLFISDSDYDSQGKSSVASMHTEGNDPDVLFDGLYSMDELKSPEKSSTAFPDKTKTHNVDTSDSEKLTKTMNLPTGSRIMNSQYVFSGSMTNKQKLSTVSMLPKSNHLPTPQYSPSYFTKENEDVKLNIKRLLEFRKQKSATDLYSNRKSVTKSDPYFHNSAVNITAPHKYGLSNTVENELRIQSGCPKAISVPNIPKVYINKQQSEQINVLKNEVDSYLSNMIKDTIVETNQINAQIGRPELRLNNEQSNATSIRPLNTHLNNAEQKIFNTPRHNSPVKIIDNVTSNTVLRSLLKPNPTDPKENVSTLEPNFQEFVKDLQRSINAGVSKTAVRSSANISVNELPGCPNPINYSAKHTKLQKKVENAPNTFARLNYMHKTKQGETVKQSNDQVTQNRLHSRPVEAKKVVNILSDTIISPGDRTVIKKTEKPTQRKDKPLTDSQQSKNLLNVDQCVIRPVALDEKLTKRPISTPAQPTNFTSPRSTMLTEKDQNQLLLLLRQQSKLNVTRPQVRDNVINKVPSTATPTTTSVESLALTLNVQNTPTYTYRVADNIQNQLKACRGLQGLTIQPYQNVSVPKQNVPISQSVPIENATIIQPRSSSVVKVSETSKANILHQNIITGNTKKIKNRPKGEIKINNEPQDWQSVMDALSAQKTPSRDLNALDTVLQKDMHQKQLSNSNTVRNQRMRNSDSSCNINNNVTNAKRKDENMINCKISPATSLVNTKNVKSSRNNVLPSTSIVPSVINKFHLHTDVNLLRKNIQPLILTRISKAEEPQISSGALKKGTNCGVSQKPSHTTSEALKKDVNLDVPQVCADPTLSNTLPTSDYDLLEELMDDDLRQEIGELLSDEENFSTSSTVLKASKLKSDNIKPISSDGSRAVDMSRNSIVRQNVCKLSKQTNSKSRADTMVFKHPVTSVQTSCENTRIKKSRHTPNTMIIHENIKNTPVIQPSTTTNIINNVPSPVIISRNIQSNPAHPVTKNVIDNQLETSDCSKSSIIIQTPKYIEQNSNINSSNPVHASSLRPTMTTIQNSAAIYTTVTHQPLQNVVLIRPEIVYEPYVQVHASSSNFNSSTFVAVPNIPIYGAQFAGPVINPVIIASPVTVSNIEDKKSLTDAAYNNITRDNASQQDTFEADKSEPDKSYSIECGTLIDNINPNQAAKTTTSSQSKSFEQDEQGVILDDLINSNLKTDIEIKTCNINKNSMKTAALQERQTEHINSKIFGEAEDNIKREIVKVPKHINLNPCGIAKEEIKRKSLKAGELINLKVSDVANHEIKKEILKIQEDSNLKTSDISENEIKMEIRNIGEHIDSNTSGVMKNEIKKDILEARENVNSKASSEAEDEIKKEILKAREDISLKTSGVLENEMKTKILKAREHIKSKISGVTEDEIQREILEAQEVINLKAPGKPKDEIKRNILEAREYVKSKVVFEDEIKKEILKVREERLKKKRTALLHRQIYIVSDSKPIPLSYAPIFKDSRENEENKTIEPNVTTGQGNTAIGLVYNGISHQKINATSNVLINETDQFKVDQKKNNTSEMIFNNIQKRNKETDEIDISDTTLRSSKDLTDNIPLLIMTQKSEIINEKEKPDSHQNQSMESSQDLLIITQKSAISNEKDKSDSDQNQSMETKDKNECKSRTLRSSANKFMQDKLLQNQKDDERNVKKNIHDTVNQSSLTGSSKDGNKIEIEKNRSTLRSSNRSVNKTSLWSESQKPDKKITIDTQKEFAVQPSDLAKLTDSLKENNKIEKNESIAIMQLPLHQLANDNSPISSKLPIRKSSTKIFKSKLRLNLKNLENRNSVTEDKEIKRITKQKVQKTQNKGDKTVKQQKSNLNFTVMTANDLRNLDIEEQLSGSIIHKTDPVTNIKDMPSEKYGVANNFNTSINKTKEKETTSKHSVDSMSNPHATLKRINSNIHCKGNVSLKNEITMVKSNVCERLASTKENVLNLTKKSDINEITPYVKLVKENENNLTNNVNSETLMCNKSISMVDNLTVRTNTKLQEVKQSNDFISENDVSFGNELCASMSSEKHTTKVKHITSNEDNEFLDSLKDKITIKELPRNQTDDPLKRCISIKLSNGNCFKATVSGKLHIDIDSFFEDPAIRSVLLNNVPSNARCIFNVQQICSMKGDKVKTKLVYAEKKNLETINLISDDEDDDKKPQAFKTEFGIFNVRGLNDSIFNKHQNKFSQKCSVIIERCKVPLNVTSPEVENNIVLKDSLTLNVCSNSNSQDLNLSQTCKSADIENTEIIEIDESSNESLNAVSESFDGQQFTIPENIDKNLKELKETLLQDLCVDIGDTEQNSDILFTHKKAHDKEIFTIFSDLKDIICKELDISKGASPNSVCSVDKSSRKYQTRESKYKRPSPLNKILPSPKRCRLNIERCDELLKRYEIQNKAKKCFVSLERCDNLVQMYAQKETYETEFKDTNKYSGTLQLKLNDTANVMENDTSSDLKRSDSFSILNDFNLFDQSGNYLNTKCRMCKNCDDFENCQADWLMSKSKYYYLSKNGSDTTLVDDDISTDCESDLDTSLTKVFFDDNTRIELSDVQKASENLIPSLLELTLKVLRNDTILESIQYKDVRTLNNSTPILKRKLSTLEYYSSDTKICKLNNSVQSVNSPEYNMSVQNNIHNIEINSVEILNETVNSSINVSNTQNIVDFNQNAELNIQNNVLILEEINKKIITSISQCIETSEYEYKNKTLGGQEIENELNLARLHDAQKINKTDSTDKSLKEIITLTDEKSGNNDNLGSWELKDKIIDLISDRIRLQEVPEETDPKVYEHIGGDSKDKTKVKQDNDEVLLEHLNSDKLVEETNLSALKQITIEMYEIPEARSPSVNCENVLGHLNLDKEANEIDVRTLKEGVSETGKVDNRSELVSKHLNITKETDIQHVQKEARKADDEPGTKNNLLYIQKDDNFNVILEQSHDKEKEDVDVMTSLDVSKIRVSPNNKKDIFPANYRAQSPIPSKVLRLEEIVTKFVVNTFDRIVSEPKEIPGSKSVLLYGQNMEEMAEEKGVTSVIHIDKVTNENSYLFNSQQQIQSEFLEDLHLKNRIENSINSLKPVHRENEEISTMKRDLLSGTLQIQCKIASRFGLGATKLNQVVHGTVDKNSKNLDNEVKEASETKRDLRIYDEQSHVVLDPLCLGETKASDVSSLKQINPDKEEILKTRQQDERKMVSKEECYTKIAKETAVYSTNQTGNGTCEKSELKNHLFYIQRDIQNKIISEKLDLEEMEKSSISSSKQIDNGTEENTVSRHQGLHSQTLLDRTSLDQKTDVLKVVEKEMEEKIDYKNDLLHKQRDVYIVSNKHYPDKEAQEINTNLNSRAIRGVKHTDKQDILRETVLEQLTLNNEIDCHTGKDKIALESSNYKESLVNNLFGTQVLNDRDIIKSPVRLNKKHAISIHPFREICEEEKPEYGLKEFPVQIHPVDKHIFSELHNLPDIPPNDVFNQNEYLNEKHDNINSKFGLSRGIFGSKQNNVETEINIINNSSLSQESPNIQDRNSEQSEKQNSFIKNDESVKEIEKNPIVTEQIKLVDSDVNIIEDKEVLITKSETEKSKCVKSLDTQTIDSKIFNERYKDVNTVNSTILVKRDSDEIIQIEYYEPLNNVHKNLESLNKITENSVSDTCDKDSLNLEQVLKEFTQDVESDTNCQNQEHEREHKNLEPNVLNKDEILTCKISPFHQTNDEYIGNGDIMAEGIKSPEIVTKSNTIRQHNSLDVNDENTSLEYICDKNSDDDVCVNSVETYKNNYVELKDLSDSKIDRNQIPKNITLLYEGESSVILKGSIIEDAIVGTCYVFPILNTDILNSVMHNSDEIVNDIKQNTFLDLEESQSPKVFNELIEDTELIVTKPKVTYSKIPRVLRRGVKRKFENVDSKIVPKKYRKGKNIDYPKITVAAMCECAYSKEFKKLSNYFSSIKFSYTKDYHLIHLEDVHTMLEDWPIKELCLPAMTISDTECSLFVEKVQKKLPDPSTQTLAEEISANYDDEDSSLDEINETNFSMGFGDGSGRVNLNFKNRKERTKFMAATLSDVKQFQPTLLPTNGDSTHEILTSRQDQLQKLNKFYTNITLRDKIRSYFKETTAMLNYSCLESNLKSTKDKTYPNSLCNDTHSIFDYNILEFFEPPMIETTVQIVQIGQLPVSAAAQNPVTCDPRVTQVTDASLPQCSMEHGSPEDMQANIKTEYTELTTADISLPMLSDYEHQHQTLISASQVSNMPNGNDNITIETEVKIEVLDEASENIDDNSCYDSKDFPTFTSNQITDSDHYQFNENDMNVQVKTEPDLKIVLEPTDSSLDEDQIPESYKSPQQNQQNGSLEKPDQLAHAMNAAGITPSPEPASEESAIDLSNTVSRSVCEETDGINYRSTIAPITLQQALSKILPQHLNPTNETESNSQNSVASQLLHIVHGKNTSVNKISLADNSQQSVANTHPTPVFHIVQSKSSPSTSISNGSPPHNSNSFNGLSLVDTGLSQGGNQLLHIVNANAPKPNTTPVLKRVNLVTNVTNAQGSCEQKMVQILCKSADAKGIQLNAHQRSMVLRLHPIETPPSTSSKSESQDTAVTANTDSPAKDPVAPSTQVELKSRSVYEENYAKFIQDCNKQAAIEPSVTLPKFNQAFFGKPVFQENNQKTNDIDVQLPSVDSNVESNCPSNGHAFENTQQIGSPLLLRKSSQTPQAQQTLTQHVKQAITPMNIQTMHGGVIYTRQIPVNIGSGQTINLITVPSTERVDDSVPKQKPDVKFATRNEVEQSFIKIVPQTPTVPANPELSSEDTNASGVSNENPQNPQPPPMLTQMRIKLPMLSKNTPMVSGARVVRPSFFQIQRNVIGGANQPVYQQLVLTAAPTLGPNSIRLPQMQANQEMKEGSENQTPSESEMSSSTLHEQLQEFDKIMEQVKERSTVQPAYDINSSSADSTENPSSSTPTETTQQILYSIGNNQQLNVAYINRKPSSATTTATTSFARSPDSSSSNIEAPSSSTHVPTTHLPRATTSETSNDSSPSQNNKPTKPSSKSKSRPKSHHPQFKFNHVPPKPSNQKPIEDEQTTQRILYILAEYKEQVENSPDKDKPAPRRRTNLQAGGVIAPGGSKSKKKRRNGRDSSPIDDNCRTMGSEDSSCGTSQGDCNEVCLDSNSPQGSPLKVAKKLSFEQDPSVTSRPQPSRNVLVTDGPTIAVTRAAPGKPATAVLMPANYILPVSMVKSGQQIAIVTNRGPKILTVGGADGGATNALLLQRLIGPSGLKPVLARPGIRHVRLPTAALQNLQGFNINAFPNAAQPDVPADVPAPASSPPQLIETKAPQSPWTAPEQEEVKPERESSPEEPEQEQEPWSVPQDYSYEETVRTEMDRTVLDAIPDRYSPDMEAERIFDKMFDVESKKDYIVESQDDSPHCPYDIDASDSDDRAYHQVVQRRDGVNNRHRFLSAATLRQKFALMEDELRLQKSLSEECEDLGVDSPSASDLFPEAELLFSSSPAHEASQQSHTPQPVMLGHSSVSPPDMEDQAATDHLIAPADSQVPEKPQADDIDLGLEDVGIVTVSEDGMRATISLDHEEFVRSHPNTTFHREPTDDGEVQPITIDDLKARHLTSTIFHASRAPATVLVTAPQTTVISQATPDGSGVDHLRCSHADNLMPSAPPKDENLDRFDSLLNDSRELHLSNSASAIIHSTNATQVIRRVCYEDRRDEPRYLDDSDGLMAEGDAKMTDDRELMDSSGDVDDRSSPERNSEMFWEMHSRSRRLDFSSDSDKCCKSPYDENNSTDSSGIGSHMRLDSVIKDARIDRTATDSMSLDEANLPPLRTYASKRTHESHSGRRDERYLDNGEGKRRASNRGVVKRGCHCCNGSSAPPKPKKPRQKTSKPHMDL